LRNLYAI